MENTNYIFRIHPDNDAFYEYVEILDWCNAAYEITENTLKSKKGHKNKVEFWTLKDEKVTLIDAGNDLQKFQKIVEYVTSLSEFCKEHKQYDFAFVERELELERALKAGYVFKIHPKLEGVEKYVEILKDCDAKYVITEYTSSNYIEFCAGYDQQSRMYDVNYEIFEDIVNHVVIAATYAERMEQFEDDIDDIIFAGGGEGK